MKGTSIVIRFDEDKNKIVFSRVRDSDLQKLKTTLITEVTIDHLKAMPLDKACRQTGENIFIFMEQTRKLLME